MLLGTGERAQNIQAKKKPEPFHKLYNDRGQDGQEYQSQRNPNENYDLQLASVMPSDIRTLLNLPPVLPQHLFYCTQYQKHCASPPETLSYPAIHSHPNFFPRTLISTGSSFLAGVSVPVCDRVWQGKADVSL